MRKKGFEIDNISYFLYCDGDRFTNSSFLKEKIALMEFKITLIPYKTDTTWIEPTLIKIKNILIHENRPFHASRCEFGTFLNLA